MRERLGAGDVVSDSVGFRRNGKHLLGWRVEERRLGVNEPPDQPRAGDAIDLRALARHPARRLRAHLAAQRQLPLGPFGDTAFEIAGINADLAQACRGVAADLQAVRAVDHDGVAALELRSPFRGHVRCPPDRPGNHPVVGIESRCAAHIDNDWRRGRATSAVQSIRRN
jgi:hypothetical protein